MNGMKELKEALIYAAVNGFVGFSIYTGSALYFGQNIKPALTSAVGIGLLVFGSYMTREEEEIDFDLKDIVGKQNRRQKAANGVKRFARKVTPICVKKRGLFRFL